ncbi:proton myo-inositol cotransporter-like [Gigantopelta aegis]|uniref:proton myo-inositol cotransporter-like n=1 Tax=Gigantopelta aegis TaxID=1735272 RepID=UPI001B889EFD|nr:proton myo-inositol cotransporter-like [Gigantopelta aegis]
MGYDIGVVSGSMLLIVPHFHLDTVWTEAIVSATVGAAALFAFSSGYLADVFGRKKIIIFSSIALATGAVIMGASPTKEILLLGRLVVGVGIEAKYLYLGVNKLKTWHLGVKKLKTWYLGVKNLKTWYLGVKKLKNWHLDVKKLKTWYLGVKKLKTWYLCVKKLETWHLGVKKLKTWYLGVKKLKTWYLGLSTSTVAVYIAESAPVHSRGRLVSLNQLLINIGGFVSNLIAGAFSQVEYIGWRFMLGLPGVAAIVQLIAFLFLPESPRWLVGRGRDEEARAVLERIRGTDDITKEFNEIQEAVVEDKLCGDGFVITKVCSTPHVRRALLIGCMLMFFQQVCGINTVMCVSSKIHLYHFSLCKRSVDKSLALNYHCSVFCFSPGVCLALCILATGFQLAALNAPPVKFTESFSNGTLYNWSCASYTNCDRCTNDVDCGFCFNVTSLGSCLPVDKDNSQTSQFGRCNGTGQSYSSFHFDVGFCPNNFMWMPVVGMALLVFSFAPGLGPMPLTINAEIYPLWARSTCGAIAMCVNWSFSLVVSFTFLTFTETITRYGTFWLYTGACVCGFISIAIFLPETKNKTLEQMEQIFMSEKERKRCVFSEDPNPERDRDS